MATSATFLKFGFLFALLIATIGYSGRISADSSFSAWENEDDGKELFPFHHALQKRALDSVVNFISEEVTSRSLAALPQFGARGLVHALTSITLFGAFKVAIFIVSTFWLLASIFPTFLPVSPFFFRSLTDGVAELKNLNYEMVARSLEKLPDKSFDMVGIKEQNCRSRVMCELGEFVGRTFPSLSELIAKFGDTLLMRASSDSYAGAMLKGIRHRASKESICAKEFSRNCKDSPLQKISILKAFF